METDRFQKSKGIHKKISRCGTNGRSIEVVLTETRLSKARYIFHNVDSYVLSKDPVDKYEPFAPVETYQYGIDILAFFQPRSGSSKNKYPIIEEVVLKWLSVPERETLILKDIFDLIRDRVKAVEINDKKITRQTLRKPLAKMVEDRLLLKEHRSKKYRLPPDQ